MSGGQRGTVDGDGRRLTVPGWDGLTAEQQQRQMVVEVMKNRPQLERLASEINRREQARLTEWLGGQLLPVMPDEVGVAMAEGLRLQRERTELGVPETTPNEKLGLVMQWMDREGWHIADYGNEFILLKADREVSRLRKVIKEHGIKPKIRLEAAEEGEAN